MQLFQKTNIGFIEKRKAAYILSISLIVIGIISIVIHGGPNYGIDFKGGTAVVFKFQDDVTTVEIRNALNKIGLGNSEIKRFGNTHKEFLVYIQQQKDISPDDLVDQVEKTLQDEFQKPVEKLQVDTVGPKIGEELRNKAVWAILWSLVLILVYISIRFEFVFAVGAIIALFHDVTITLGIFSLLDFEISLKEIAAFLTIVGYSLNDTIVVFDRIRENLKVMRNEDLGTIINTSINQTLSRTVITSGTTFIVVLVLFLFGGTVIRGFAFAMCVGVIVGTYSSIFVASPLILEWQGRHGGTRELKMAKKKK